MEFLFTFWTVNCVIALIVYLVYRAVRKGKNQVKNTQAKASQAKAEQVLTREQELCVSQAVTQIEVYKHISQKFSCDEGKVLSLTHSNQRLIIEANFGDYPIDWAQNFIDNFDVYVWNDHTLGRWKATTNNYGNTVLRWSCSASVAISPVMKQIAQKCGNIGLRVNACSDNYLEIYAKDTSNATTGKSNSAPNTKCERSDSDILKKVEYALRLVNQLKDEDEGNFLNFTILGLSGNKEVSFGIATELLIKVQYCGSSVTWAWQQASYVPYDKYKELFVLVTGQSGDYFFVANVKLEGASAVTTLNAALQNAGFAQKVNSGSKSLYCSLL